ncbi:MULTISPECIES: ribose-5-phosphate isomerase RpiA [Methanobacterium]|uniref:Ribose-5-phosphate isomerase A n=1 Tax=Methanobacterium bryantii TaxID=2161 RepID=A0A2A2H430_METBR|nr:MULTISPECIES: ribose-5-phosphate isomerase RpiA [Methanobacterium]OEC86761.1 ribose 5-phosphate isomerase A [Methanobacterium sp. A39]PAV04040.1 ribose 5-phosphate isomerase [Methanobacterium bryantii]
MELKRNVGYAAAKLVEDGNIVGLGTGSTTLYFLEKLGKRIIDEELEILGIPTSYQSFLLAKENGIPVTTLEEHSIDIAVDGADEVDSRLNLIKGGGAAHTMEKIVDSAADKFIVIVDDSKVVDKLGAFPVPVEVIPQACRTVSDHVKQFGGVPALRMGQRKGGPVITDNGNFVIDVKFESIEDPAYLEKELNYIPGVVENGIFFGVTDEVLVGSSEGIKSLKK